MKRYMVVPVLMALAIWVTSISASSEALGTQSTPASCTVQNFRPWSAKVWDPSNWARGKPSKTVLDAYAKRLGCAPPAHRKAMKATWGRDQGVYLHKRHAMLWLAKYKPFVYPSGKRWAAPYPVAVCESGENYYVGPAGAYGLILAPSYMSPKAQDEEAYHLLHTVGAEQAWFRWEREQGCPYL